MLPRGITASLCLRCLRHDAALAASPDAARLFRRRFPDRLRALVLPQLDSAEQPFLVADDLHALGRLEADELGVAAAEIEPIVVECDLEILDRLAQPLVPPLLALLEQRPMPQFVFVGLALVERMMPKLEVDTMAVDENHRAHAGAERDHQLDATAGDAAEALHVGIVGDARRTLERAGELPLQREIIPSLAQVGCGIDDAAFGHAGKPDRD